MSAAKHTRGPWAISQDYPGYVTTADQQRTVACTAHSVINAAHDPAHTMDEAEANARLIAAAPDLLAALDALLSYGHGERTRADALAAIAKATGVPR